MIKFSILIPTYNNLDYLKLAIKSIKENSSYHHEIILHINDGSDGTLDYVKKHNIDYTYSDLNIGLCSSINMASKKVTTDYILYVHDDMYLCKNWDKFLENEIKNLDDDLFYFSGTNYESRDIAEPLNPGNSPDQFNPEYFYKFCSIKKGEDLQGSHWAPHIISKRLWDIVGGFSEEFNPGDGSDPDFCMKLWINNVRIFKSIDKFKVFHFGSRTTRNKKIVKNNGTKKFLLKYGFNPKFFRKYYLKGGAYSIFDGPLTDPKISIIQSLELFVNKVKYFYYKLSS
jgi:glycosyltransferase involved in cell wall biosynthesis